MDFSTPIPIIILNWNGLADTRECIASLELQSYQNFEIYLVDNGSSVEEVKLLKLAFEKHPKIHLFFNRENLGFTLGNNAILKQILESSTLPRFLVLLNNDTLTDPSWLAELIEVAEAQNADMVASKMINYFDRNRMDNAGHQLLNTLEILPLGHDQAVEDFNQMFENIGPCAGAALYSIEMLKQMGTFDHHFENGYEDVEIGLRGIVCGYKAVFAPKAIVYHKISRSINKIRDFDYTLKIQQHIYYIIIKLIPTGALIICLPFLIFRTGAAIVINLLFFRWKYLRIQWLALTFLFTKQGRKFWQSRSAFFDSHTTISTWQLMKKMDFFLKKDLQRFYKYLIRGEKMVFEKYD